MVTDIMMHELTKTFLWHSIHPFILSNQIQSTQSSYGVFIEISSIFHEWILAILPLYIRQLL